MNAAEGYRERWLAGKPRAQSKTWCSMLCCVCEQGSDDFGMHPILARPHAGIKRTLPCCVWEESNNDMGMHDHVA